MNHIRKFISSDQRVQLITTDLSHLIHDSMKRIDAWPPAMIHLGQGFLGLTLLRSLLDKEDQEKLSLHWKCDGPFGQLYVESSDLHKIRGTVLKPQAKVDNLQTPLGNGILQVRRIGKRTNTGIVDASGSVVDDLLAYLSQSEQRQCALNLYVDLTVDDSHPDIPFKVKKAIGYLLEVLPASSQREFDLITEAWSHRLEDFGPLSKWSFNNDEPYSYQIADTVLPSNYKELVYRKIDFFCTCSQEKALMALKIADQQEPQTTSEPPDVRCEFCGKSYSLG